MRISFIVAKSLNNVIGFQNKLPWRLKDDLEMFKKLTMGHHILMGRKTFESIGRPLPGRMSLVVSSEPRMNEEGVFWFNSLFKAIKQAERSGENELFIIGGEKIYKSALSLCDRIYLTEVNAEIEGDTFFPSLSAKNWKKVGSQQFFKSSANQFDFEFQILDRK
jgi:dihydrofolate reductase